MPVPAAPRPCQARLRSVTLSELARLSIALVHGLIALPNVVPRWRLRSFVLPFTPSLVDLLAEVPSKFTLRHAVRLVHADRGRLRDPLHNRGQRAGERHWLAPGVCYPMLARSKRGRWGGRRANDGIDVIFTSDLARAVETVRIAFPDPSVPALMDWRLRECDYG